MQVCLVFIIHFFFRPLIWNNEFVFLAFCLWYPHSDPKKWLSTSSPTYKPKSKHTSAPSKTTSLPTPAQHDNDSISGPAKLIAMLTVYEKVMNGSASVNDIKHHADNVQQFG